MSRGRGGASCTRVDGGENYSERNASLVIWTTHPLVRSLIRPIRRTNHNSVLFSCFFSSLNLFLSSSCFALFLSFPFLSLPFCSFSSSSSHPYAPIEDPVSRVQLDGPDIRRTTPKHIFGSYMRCTAAARAYTLGHGM